MSSASVVCLSFCCFVAAPAGDATKAAATSSRISRLILPPFSNAVAMGRLIISHVADFAIWLPAVSVDRVTERGQGHARILGTSENVWAVSRETCRQSATHQT